MIFCFFHRYCIIQPNVAVTKHATTQSLPLCFIPSILPSSLSLVFCPLCLLREHPAHVTPDSRVVEQILDGTDSRDGDVLVPDLSSCKVHNVLGCHCVDRTLNLAGGRPSAGGDDLATDVLGQGGGAIKRQEDGSLQLGLGTLGLGLADGLGQAGPFTQGEVDEVVNLGELVGGEVDTPETIDPSVQFYQEQSSQKFELTRCRCSWWRNS